MISQKQIGRHRIFSQSFKKRALVVIETENETASEFTREITEYSYMKGAPRGSTGTTGSPALIRLQYAVLLLGAICLISR